MPASPDSAVDPYAPLRRAPFRRFLAGSLSANLSTQILRVASVWYLYHVTRSAWVLALVGLMSYLPILLLSLPAGWASDHFERRRVLAFSLGLQAFSALALAALTGLDGPVWPWYPLLFLGGCGRALQAPAGASLYPQFLRAEEVARGVSWNSTMQQAGTVGGLLAGGVLLRWLGVTWTLGCVLAGPLVFLASLWGLKTLREIPAPLSEGWREKLLGGFGFVWSQKPILGALSVDFVAVLFGGVSGILSMFAADILRCGPDGLGALMAATFFGSMLMSFFLAHRPVFPRPGRTMLLAVAGFGACMLAFGLSRSFVLSLLVLTVSGVLDQVSVYVRQSLVQLRTPEALRGRVQAVNFLFIGSSNELGAFESGLTAALMGPVGSVLMGGAAVLLVVLGAGRVFPALLGLQALAPEPEA